MKERKCLFCKKKTKNEKFCSIKCRQLKFENRTLTVKELRVKIDLKRGLYVKEKNKDFRDKGYCISCGIYREVIELQVGHYYSRVHDFTTALGFCEENTQLQCVPCNYVKRGNPQGFGYGLVRKYDVQILQKLQEAKNTPKRYTIKDYELLIEKYSL